MHYGFIIPHSREIIDVSRSNPFGIELDAQWLLAREKYTRNSGVVARRGIVLHYFNFDTPRVLGHCVADVFDLRLGWIIRAGKSCKVWQTL
ncbi:MAG: hypothetical protein IPK76_09535 [Lewinellaceae bacterium]|jgi:hypothetical protein|nr:hypothetical protein [Lewinellaceae bacterium]